MNVRTSWSVLAGFLLLGCWMTATAQQYRSPVQRQPVARPTAPPQNATQAPALQNERRAIAPQAPPAPNAPFVLNPQDQANVNWALQQWEERGAAVQRFESDFVRYVYKPAMAQFPQAPNFRNPDRPFRVVTGKLKFATPDKGRMEVIGELVGGVWANGNLNGAKLVKDEQRRELLICDGRSVSQFDFGQRVVHQLVLPPEMQGEAIVDGPLPFLFNAKAAKLKARYFIRIADQQRPGEIGLEAWPRMQRDAADFFKADILLDAASMLPMAVQLHAPQLEQANQGNRTVYKFSGTKINAGNWLDFLKDDPFKPSTPSGWTLDVKHPETQQARRPGVSSRSMR